MKTVYATMVLHSLFSLQLLFADPPSGVVTGWGHNVAGEAVGVPSFPFSNGVVIVTDNPFATGRVTIVTIAGQPLRDAVAISAGSGFSLALKDDGTVVGWGDNQMGRAIGTEPVYPYRTNGSVMVGGKPLSNVVSVVAGGNFSLALKGDGTLVTWGKNTIPAGLSNVVAIAASGFFSVALKRDGTVVSWSSLPPAVSHVPRGLSNVVAIACGGSNYERSMALKSDGTVVVWQSGFPEEEPVPVEATNLVAIVAGVCHSLALKRDGTVFGWGCNSSGQATGIPTVVTPSESSFSSGFVTLNGQVLSNVVAIAAGDDYNLALKNDGSVVAWGNKRSYKDIPAGLTSVTAISAGDGFCLVIKKP